MQASHIKLFLFSILLLPLAISAQSISKQKASSILDLIDAKQYDSAFAYLNATRSNNPDDPELVILLANYYFSKCQQEAVVMSKEKPSNGVGAALRDSITGKPVSYMKDSLEVNQDTLQEAINILTNGIGKYPQRIDFRISLIQATEVAQQFGNMTNAIVDLLKMNAEHTSWLCAFSEPYPENPDSAVLNGAQYSASLLFHFVSDTNDSLLTEISKTMILYYPNSVYGYTNLGVLQNAKENYKEAMSYLLKAHEIDTSDAIILINLAQISEKIGNVKEACNWYRKVIATNSPDESDYARKKLDELAQ